jgi:hypothetical protein
VTAVTDRAIDDDPAGFGPQTLDDFREQNRPVLAGGCAATSGMALHRTALAVNPRT